MKNQSFGQKLKGRKKSEARKGDKEERKKGKKEKKKRGGKERKKGRKQKKGGFFA